MEEDSPLAGADQAGAQTDAQAGASYTNTALSLAGTSGSLSSGEGCVWPSLGASSLPRPGRERANA